MPCILRSDSAKGYVRHIGDQRDLTPAKEASFLGLPSEIRNEIYRLVFAAPRLTITAWSVLLACHQVHQEASTILFTELELAVLFYNDAVFFQVPTQIIEFVLPHVRKISFNRHLSDDPMDWWRVTSFLYKAPLLQNLRFEGLAIGNSLRITEVYQAIANTVTHWVPRCTRHSKSGHSSHNKFLLRNAFELYGLQHECTSGPLESNLTRAGRSLDMHRPRGELTGTVESFLKVDDSARMEDYDDFDDYLEASRVLRADEERQATITITFNFETLQILHRTVSVNWGRKIHTVRDARVWAFGEQGCILEGETAEQAELEGQKLLSELLDSS